MCKISTNECAKGHRGKKQFKVRFIVLRATAVCKGEFLKTIFRMGRVAQFLPAGLMVFYSKTLHHCSFKYVVDSN